MNCIVCNIELSGMKRMYCSRKCKGKRHSSYTAQRSRSLLRKRQLVKLKGGRCSFCGYSRNLAALVFHHQGGKDFPLDSKMLSNRSWEVIVAEVEKCILLCANCHMEEHYPTLTN